MSVEMVPCKLNGKWEITLPKHRADRPEWYTEKGWEKARLEAMHKDIKEGTIVYYVGAEEGDMCGLCAKWGAWLVMFEPNEKVWPNVKAIWEANDLKVPVCVDGFAANETEVPEGKPLFYLGFPPSADGEVIGDHGFKELHANDPEITKVKIDDMVDGPGAMIPDIITMDVEGAEWEVLKGAEHVIRNHRPIIYLSLHPEFLFRIYEKYSYEVRQWIQDLGYTEELLDYQHEVHLVYRPKENS